MDDVETENAHDIRGVSNTYPTVVCAEKWSSGTAGRGPGRAPGCSAKDVRAERPDMARGTTAAAITTG